MSKRTKAIEEVMQNMEDYNKQVDVEKAFEELEEYNLILIEDEIEAISTIRQAITDKDNRIKELEEEIALLNIGIGAVKDSNKELQKMIDSVRDVYKIYFPYIKENSGVIVLKVQNILGDEKE